MTSCNDPQWLPAQGAVRLLARYARNPLAQSRLPEHPAAEQVRGCTLMQALRNSVNPAPEWRFRNERLSVDHRLRVARLSFPDVRQCSTRRPSASMVMLPARVGAIDAGLSPRPNSDR